jgi:CBS domain containing-hemolysin-like protein
MLILLVSASIAIGTSAMCSLFEAVLYSVPVGYVETQARTRRSGRILSRLRADVDRPISAILSLNTIANTGGAAVAGAAAADVFGHRGLPYFSVAFTLVILFLSEIVPKTMGVVYSRPLAHWVALPLAGLVVIFTPFIWVSRLITRAITKGADRAAISDDELIVMARLGLQSGTIDPDEMAVIQNILHLERRTVADVMTPRTVMTALPADMTAADARRDPGVLAHGRLPVYGRSPDDVIGLVHRRDILVATTHDPDKLTMEDVMKPVHFVSETARLDQILRTFLDRRQHLFVVVDSHGGVAGVITLEDVLEEILGKEIVDEFDREVDLREVARERRDALLSSRGDTGDDDPSGSA